MKRILFFVPVVLILSCNGNGSDNSKDSLFNSDPVKNAAIAKHIKDSLMNGIKTHLAESLIDTVGLYKAPVKVLSATLVKHEYSNYRDISLTYKNVSQKKIQGIKFKWYGINAFKEPADMGGSIVEGIGGGFTDDILSPNKKETASWNILSRDGKKVVLAWPIEVAFTDGSSWKL